MTTRAWLVFAASLLTPACGSQTIAEPGRGSNTMQIDARAEVENTVPNASSDDQFNADLVVHLTKSGQPVVGATVEIASSIGTVTLAAQGDPGRYEGHQAGYAGAYTLSARLGDDFIEGVSLSGPEAHSFSAPVLAAQVTSGQALEVKWSPSGSTKASLSTRELDQVNVPDTGSYTIPGSGLRSPDPGKTEDERVRVTRSESISPAGGTGSSNFTVSIRNEVTILVVN